MNKLPIKNIHWDLIENPTDIKPMPIMPIIVAKSPD